MRDDPSGSVALFHMGKFDESAPVAEGFADAVEPLFILHVHAAQIGRQMEVIGDEKKDGLRVG